MKCHFLRHGLAVEADEWNGTDFDRPLTDEGRAQMKHVAKAMDALHLEIDVIVTSPLVRAKQTASIVAKTLRLQNRVVEDERLGGEFGPDRLADVLAQHRTVNAVMLVGHEPGMSRTLGHLVGGAHIEFKKGSLACVNVPDPPSLQGELVWLIPAKVLAPKGSDT